MITLAGSSHLKYAFPAPPRAALAYYRDIPHTLALLPHISILEQYNDYQYRMLYATLELGLYRVHLICDIQVQADEAENQLHIEPFQAPNPVRSQAGLNALTAAGFYHSVSRFLPAGTHADEQTEIDYRLQLDACLPVPTLARFMPTAVLNALTHSITNARIQEIAGSFMRRSLADYQAQRPI